MSGLLPFWIISVSSSIGIRIFLVVYNGKSLVWEGSSSSSSLYRNVCWGGNIMLPSPVMSHLKFISVNVNAIFSKTWYEGYVCLPFKMWCRVWGWIPTFLLKEFLFNFFISMIWLILSRTSIGKCLYFNIFYIGKCLYVQTNSYICIVKWYTNVIINILYRE